MTNEEDAPDNPEGAQKPVGTTFVRMGTILEGATAFSFNGNVNSTWRGQVLLDDGSIVRAFIKDLAIRELANELLAASIGLSLGLPIPIPILARAEKSDLSAECIPLDESGYLVFASSEAPAGPILQMIRNSPDKLDQIMDRVSKWDGLGSLYGFDTWVANIDRHRGNFLFGGQDDVWLIDHGFSFTGPKWVPSDLVPSASYMNKLALWVTPYLTPSRKSQLAPEASAAAAKLDSPALGALAAANSVDVLLGSDLSAVLTFLEERAAYVSKQSTQALGLLL